MTDDDELPHTPPPRPSVSLPSFPPPPHVPGDFGRSAPPTEPAPSERTTLTPADLSAIAQVFEAVLDARTQIHVDALNAAKHEVAAAREELQATATWVTGEARGNLAQISELAGVVKTLADIMGVSLQQTTLIRQTIAPNHEGQPVGAAKAASTSEAHGGPDGARATIELLPVTDEEEPTDTGRR